jgi:hypothetical protein
MFSAAPLLQTVTNLDGSRRFYPPGQHPATYRLREWRERLLLLPVSGVRDESLAVIDTQLSLFEQGENEAKRAHLRMLTG